MVNTDFYVTISDKFGTVANDGEILVEEEPTRYDIKEIELDRLYMTTKINTTELGMYVFWQIISKCLLIYCKQKNGCRNRSYTHPGSHRTF